MDRIQPGVSGQGGNGSSNACLPCRRVKMKCRLDGNATTCTRCNRKGLDCLFMQHRRGRKRRNTSRSPTPERAPLRFTAVPTLPPVDRRNPPPSEVGSARVAFSLERILTTEREIGPKRTRESSLTSIDDPVCCGILNQAVAANLFESFMKHLNPFVSQLDPMLHTFSYVRQRSPFLLAAILAAAARTFNPAIHKDLREHTERLFAQNFIRGESSPEVIQAVLILTYWKQPDDTRAFINVGLAIRMAIELGWHTLTVQPDGINTAHAELERRQIRSIQRTWLVLFVYDKSISMQTGKPSMVEPGGLIESVNDWYQSPLAISNDGLLCAFVELRLMTSNVLELLQPRRDGDSTSLLACPRLLLNSLSERVQRWKSKWSKTLDTESHRFLIPFYGNHLLFTIYSARMPTSLPQGSAMADLDILWRSYGSAIDMLQSVADQTTSSILFFMQDSLHVMIAHAVIFLTKLLLSITWSLRKDIEPTVLSTIRSAQHAFTLQAAPSSSGCGMQARFLDNLVALVARLEESNGRTSPPASQDMERSNCSASQMHSHMLRTNSRPGEAAVGYLSTDLGASADTGLSEEGIQDLSFFDDEMWSTMFASAGFDIHDDAFLLGTTPYLRL